MATDDFYRVVSIVNGARAFSDVFVVGSGDTTAKLGDIKRTYREAVRHVHPDRLAVCDKDTGSEAFQMLTEYYQQAIAFAQTGRSSVANSAAVFESGRAKHTVKSRLTEDCDAAACFLTETEKAGIKTETFLKVSPTSTDNDLLAAEAEVLRRLRESGDPKRWIFYPELVDTFAIQDKTMRLRANAIVWLDNFVNLETVKRAYPAGIEPLDAAWMWRRLLWTLDDAHQKGVIHGAVLPQNVMIWPEKHGLILVDWCYSVQKTGDHYQPIKAVVGRQREWYPEEVLVKKEPTPATDLVMAARVMVHLMGGDPTKGQLPISVPRQLKAYFLEHARVGAKPQGAITLLAQFDATLEQMGEPYFPRKFRPFKL